ncbi:hypothetical protein [Ferroacidibacillus organovorans]|uniref:Uncharacterized protein n=1 Tax=Ferroacidibacillus organovorans TaxID=1765683 RepID=A0A117SYQ2_9BACL|nr:hypothetical protein [Ferroacidibacillus organovorans]KUO97293.1 hypothetical protein ATW55_11935 [Ferroacidibacillus organovorans]
MSILNRIRTILAGERYCSDEHLEGYLEQYHFSEVNKLVILDKMIKKEEGIQMRVYDKEFKEEALKLSSCPA